MKLSNCTARVSHWLFGTLNIEDMGAHWRFTGYLLGFQFTWYRKTRGLRPLFLSSMKPSFGIRYVGAPMSERRQDVWVFVPSWRRRPRYPEFGVEYASPEMPGCIFVRIPGRPAWLDLRNHILLGPIGRNGELWWLPCVTRTLASIVAMTWQGPTATPEQSGGLDFQSS